MKIKFWPKKDTVIALLQLQIDKAADEVAKWEKKEEALKGKKGLIIPGEESQVDTLLSGWRETLIELTDKRSLLESDACSHVSAETEI